LHPNIEIDDNQQELTPKEPNQLEINNNDNNNNNNTNNSDVDEYIKSLYEDDNELDEEGRFLPQEDFEDEEEEEEEEERRRRRKLFFRR